MMADGYLETRREQYEQRKALWLKQKRSYTYMHRQTNQNHTDSKE